MALNNIISRNFPGINALNVSLVEETEPKDYHTRFFMFVKAIPSVKSDQSPTGKTYDNNAAVTFKMEAEKALAFAFALKQYAMGKGKSYDEHFGSFEIYADMSKSQYGGNGGSKKSMKLQMGTNSKTSKANINMFFNQEGGKPVAFFLTPYEANSLGTIVEFISMKCIELELQGPGMVVKKQFQTANGSKPTNSFKQTPVSQETYKPTPQDTQGVNQAAGSFGNLFGGSDNPFGGD